MGKKKKGEKRSPAIGYLNKIKKLRKEEVTKDSIVELNKIVRKYLKLKYKLKFSLTSEELLGHLEKKRIKKSIKLDIRHLIIQIYKLEYRQREPISVSEFDAVSKLAFRTIQEIATNKKIKEVKSEKKSKAKKEKEKVSKKKKEGKVKEKGEGPTPGYKKLEKILKSLGKDFHTDWKDEEIRKTYEKIRLIYSIIPDSEKIKIYPKIKELFDLSKIKKSKKN